MRKIIIFKFVNRRQRVDVRIKAELIVIRSRTLNDTGMTVTVPYTQGMWEGRLVLDWAILQNQSEFNSSVFIACITKSSEFFINGSDWQGILGMSYAEVARVSPKHATM